MLFYPDQYFYQSQNPRRKTSQRQASPRASRRQAEFEETNPWEELFQGSPAFAFQQQQQQQPSPRRRSSYLPDEYVVVDEEELAALRAYRESRRRQQQEVQRREALIARRKAEEERRLKEAARRDAELRMRAQIEANARAAARDYYRRKQAQQLALQQAQYAERQQRQQMILEQLRNQFGFFNVTANEDPQDRDEDENQESAASNEAVAQELCEKIQAAAEEGAEEGAESAAADGESEQLQSQSQEPASNARAPSQSQVDPIRTLLEALAPFPIVFTTESSDEEEEAASQPPTQESARRQDGDEEDKVLRFGSDDEGPTCETASEDSEEPAFVEFIDPLVRPPVDDEPISDEDELEDRASSKKDRSKQRQTKDPKNRLKKQKHNDSKKRTDAETVGLLHALSEDLKRIHDGYNHINGLPKPKDVKEAVSRVEGIKIGYARSEEIYNRLDQIRVGKDQRKVKHEITADAVALADKFDELLKSANAVKQELHSAEKSPSRDESPVHQVTLEEVADESD